jgi:uncharacterized cupin superfamily protein
MTAYSHVNFKEIEDVAQRFGLSPSLEFRLGRKPLELERSGVSYMKIAPGFRVPFGHKHETQEEVYVLLSGSARARVGDETIELKPWDALRLAPDTMRALEAGAEGAELLLVGAPATEGSDAEMEQGWWTD